MRRCCAGRGFGFGRSGRLFGFSPGFVGGVLFKEGFNDKAPLDFYWMLCGIGVITGVVLLLLVPVLNKMLKGAD